jgi:hypothetical protein
VFHVELRRFPHVARAFNLNREELDTRIVAPWVAGRPVELDQRRWEPDRAQLTIYDAPELRPDQLGQGRGWANVTRDGTDVTAGLLVALSEPEPGDPSVVQLKRRLEELCAVGAVVVRDVPSLVDADPAALRPSRRLALAEQAIWELLHQGRIRMFCGEVKLAPHEWEPVLLAWETWAEVGPAGQDYRLIARNR